MSRRIAFLIPIIFAIPAAFILHYFARPQVVVEFEAPFDPIGTRVMLGKTKLYPSGEGGRVFKGRGSVFKTNEKITVLGAFIATQEISLETSVFGTAQETVKLTSQSADDVVKSFVGANTEISRTKVFDKSWIVSLPASSSPGEDQVAVVLQYDDNAGKWNNVTDAILFPETTIDVPAPVRSYFYELSDD